jgi:hypothetical protein
MKRYFARALPLCAMLAFAGSAHAQFAPTGTTTVSVNVRSEASLQITDTTTSLSNTGAIFGTDFTGSTAFLYKIRTGQANGTGNIQLRVSSDFTPSGGPSVYTPPTAGDTLSYTCTVASPGSGCSGTLDSGAVATAVASFGADAKSLKTGSAGSVSWTLSNDPRYSTGTYQATVTFSISAT